ncbi:hypothetical protein PAPHI01_1221 [Pancytospora philotis]|nr:hypothetical protein PAPHI01_1221 [Pancytospora philotis]
MIVDKSAYFHKMRVGQPHSVCYTSLDHIRDEITRLNVAISGLRRKLDRQALPSFASRMRKTQEINTCKENINAAIRTLDTHIKSIAFAEERMAIAAQSYFLTMLKRIVMLYRTVQRESMRGPELYGEGVQPGAAPAECSMLQRTISQTTQIRQSIYSLTNVLLELKLALKNQSTTIDRIDFFFDQSNFYLEEANKEIAKIPSCLDKYKDGAICALLYLVCVLLILILIKTARRNGVF